MKRKLVVAPPPHLERRLAGTYNLQLDRLAIELNGANLKVYANSRDVAFSVRVVRKPKEQAGFANTCSFSPKSVSER